MRESRKSGSEGGAVQANAPSLPLSKTMFFENHLKAVPFGSLTGSGLLE
jgi:hypothetical protein